MLIVGGGTVLALVGTASARPAASRGPSRHLAGSKLLAQSATPVIARIAHAGEPPDDVIGALAVPAGSRYVSKQDLDRGISQFDRSVTISVSAPASEVSTFFLKLLNDEKWTLTSLSRGSHGNSELIGQRDGSDGYQWRVAIVVKGVSVGVSPALGGSGASAARSTARIALYQVEDAS